MHNVPNPKYPWRWDSGGSGTTILKNKLLNPLHYTTTYVGPNREFGDRDRLRSRLRFSFNIRERPCFSSFSIFFGSFFRFLSYPFSLSLKKPPPSNRRHRYFSKSLEKNGNFRKHIFWRMKATRPK